MGYAIALRLAGKGANIVILDKSPAPKSLYPGDKGWAGLDTVAFEIEAQGQEALAVVADVSNSQELDEAVAKALEKFGKIDILVHAAAIRGSATTPIVDITEEDWKKVLDINLNGIFLITKAVAKSIIAKGIGGKIVLISSMGGY
jgi:NAD(P)-dependent dehydrogenase (short-subunit alcohol dehydrogenase family)